MSPPFMSDYKKWFVVKRLCQTFVGGPKLICPLIFIILQFIIFILPAGIFCTVTITTNNLVSIAWKSLTVGLVIFLLDTVISFVLFILKGDKSLRRAIIPNTSDILYEENYVIYEGFFSPSTWIFIAPNATLTFPHFICMTTSAASFLLCTPLLMSEHISPLLRGIALFSLCNARYSSAISTPPEMATFDLIKQGHPIYRPFYCAILGLIYFICSISSPANETIVQPFVIAIGILPILWGLGILPPLSALVPWILETALRILGGSATFYYTGSLLGLIFTLVASVLVFISGQQSLVLTIFLQCVFGYLINSDIGQIAKLNPSKGIKYTASKGFFDSLTTFGASLLITSLTTIYVTKSGNHELFLTISFALLLLLELLELLCSIPSRRYTYQASLLHFILEKSLLGFLTIWLTIEIASIEKSRSGVQSLHYLVTYALGIRGYGRILTFTKLSVLDLGIATILSVYIGGIFREIEFTTSLIVCGVIREKLQRCLKYLNMIRLILQADLVSQLLESPYHTTGIALIFLPISAICVTLSILINGAVLYPLFTLPIFLISFPRPCTFWSGRWFNRKVNMGKEYKNLDYIMYKQIGPELVKAFFRNISVSRTQLRDGSCYIARYEDRLMFFRVITVGWNYSYLQIKGLELQEQTSCHHQEAACLDELFENVIRNRSRFCPYAFRKLKYLSSIVTPIASLKIPTYSESKSAINNLSTSSEKKIFEKMFFKAFSYLWIKVNPIFKGEAYRRSITNSGYGIHTTPNYVPEVDSDLDEDGLIHITKHNYHSNFIEAGITPVIPRYTTPAFWSSNVPIYNDPYGYEHGDSNRKDNFLRRLSTPGSNQENHSTVDTENDGPWIKKLVGQTIPPNAVGLRVRKLVKKILQIVLGEARDYMDIDLYLYFKEDFLISDSVSTAIAKLDKAHNIVDITKKAFRYASKLTLDAIFSSTILMEESDISLPTEDETFDQLCLYDHDYVFCTFSQIPYYVENKQKHIITINKNEQKISQFRIFNYEGTGVEFHIGKLNEFVVEGIWGNLNVELLYLTSDDDERFSIQHDRYLLRNILTQCANSPLGYPVYDEIYRLSLLNNFEPELIEQLS